RCVETRRDAVTRGIRRMGVRLTDLRNPGHRRVRFWPATVSANAAEARGFRHVHHWEEICEEIAGDGKGAAVYVSVIAVARLQVRPAPGLQLGAVGIDGGWIPDVSPEVVGVRRTAVYLQITFRAQSILLHEPAGRVANGCEIVQRK